MKIDEELKEGSLNDGSVERWMESSGRELLFGGQGKLLPRWSVMTGGLETRREDVQYGDDSTGMERRPHEQHQLPVDQPAFTGKNSTERCRETDEHLGKPHSTGTACMISTPSQINGEERGLRETRTPKSYTGKERCHRHLETCGDNFAGANTLGLLPPRLHSGERINGTNKQQSRKQNKQNRIARQVAQESPSYWRQHAGAFVAPKPDTSPNGRELSEWRGEMCPRGLALHHPAAGALLQYATGGCPVNSGQNWTEEMIETAVKRGPHVSALVPEAMEQLLSETLEKEKKGQCRIVEYEDLKRTGLPPQLKISPIAMIPHKSRQFRAILDLSFRVKLQDGSYIPSVNETTTLEAPAGAIDQMGHALHRVIHAFAEADESAKIFMAKFDIKDGFWRLDCQAGEEWNFAYVLPQEEGKPIKLVVPTSLQMGWVESPPYFCAASETARDVAEQYAETRVGSLPTHKFISHAMAGQDVESLPETGGNGPLQYFIDVYVDDFIPMAIATSKEQLEHVATAVMTGIHDVFPANVLDTEDPISFKKIMKGEGTWALQKDILGFTFDGEVGRKTMILEQPKRDFLLLVLHKWIRAAKKGPGPVPFP